VPKKILGNRIALSSVKAVHLDGFLDCAEKMFLTKGADILGGDGIFTTSSVLVLRR
jgi:hypothetical protein